MKHIKKYYINFLSFIIPMCFFFIVCSLNNLYPVGDYYMNIYDGYLQHTGFLEHFKHVLLGDNSLFFSLKGAMGYNFYAVFIYYLASPLNILSIFFDNNHLHIFYTLIIYLKIGLCGLTCSILLKYFNNKNKYIILFSSCYALMSYNILYFLNIMWLDSIIMLPLVVLGIEKLVNDNKKTLYLISLSLSIIFNFYIGYMIGIFSIIYFIYKYLILDKDSKNKSIIKDFIITTLLSVLISSVILIPVLLELLNGKAEGFTQANQTDYFSFGYDFFNIFYKLTPAGFNPHDMAYGNPNLYVSLFVVVLVILFFFNRNIKLKEKIVVGSIIAFYILCLSFNLFDYAWHMFQRPIWYPNRYTFTFDLFLIIIAFKSFNNLKHIKISRFVIITVFTFIFTIISSSIYNDVYDSKEKLLFLALAILLIIDYLFVFTTKFNIKKLLIIFVILELFINSYYLVKTLPHNNTITYMQLETSSLNKHIKIIKDKDKSFYRMELNSTPNYNNGGLFHYNGINFFSSIRNGNLIKYFTNIGVIVRDGCSIKYNSFNPVINTYLGIKYFDGDMDEDYYKRIYDKDRILYYNDLTTPFMYYSNNSVFDKKLKNKKYENNYNIIYQSITNKKDLFDEEFDIDLDKSKLKGNIIYTKEGFSNITYSKTVEENGWIIFPDYDKYDYHRPEIYVNGKETKDFTNRKTTVFLKPGDHIQIKYNIGSRKVRVNDLKVLFVRYDALKEYSDTLNKKKIDYKVHKDNFITASVNNKKKSYISTTIPYSKGWTVKVDGKRVEIKKVFDTFIGLEVPKGNHKITFRFIPQGFIIGLLLSILGIVLSIKYIKKKE